MTAKRFTAPALTPSGHFEGKDGRKLTISGKIRAAIGLMIEEGLTRQAAAEKAGIKDHSLYVALTKPHVKAFRMGLINEQRTSEGQRAYIKLTKLGDTASSEHVQMEASKWVAGVDGISPVQKQDVRHSGVVGIVPGYTIERRTKRAGDDALDVTPTDPQSVVAR